MIELLEKINPEEELLLVLDYDGTLLDFCETPSKAVLPLNYQELLSKISRRPNIRLIINTGRTSRQIQQIILDKNIEIIADHGLSHRMNGEWKDNSNLHLQWKNETKTFLREICLACPGSFIEDKTYSLCWHYRTCEEKIGQFNLQKVREFAHNQLVLGNTRIIMGKYVIEIISKQANKGNLLYDIISTSDFEKIIGIGDDITDEDIFEVLQQFDNNVTVKVGAGATSAEFRIDSWKDTWTILKQLTK